MKTRAKEIRISLILSLVLTIGRVAARPLEKITEGITFYNGPSREESLINIRQRNSPTSKAASPVYHDSSALDEHNNTFTPVKSFIGATLKDSKFIPPDGDGAVGPLQYVVCVNGRIKSFDKKSGLPDGILDATTNDFFSLHTSNTIHARVRYDCFTNRWFILMTDNHPIGNQCHLAVSDTGIITQASRFTFFTFSARDTEAFQNLVSFGLDESALYIGTNAFTNREGTYIQSNAFIIQKSSLNNSALAITEFVISPQGSRGFTPQGVNNYFYTAPAYGFFVTNAPNRLILTAYQNTNTTNPTFAFEAILPLDQEDNPSSFMYVPAQGSAFPLDSLDDRFTQPHIRPSDSGAPQLWTAQTIATDKKGVSRQSMPPNDRISLRFYQIDLSRPWAPELIQMGTLFDTKPTSRHVNYWVPALATNGQLHMVLASSVAGTAQAASAQFTDRLATDALGTLREPIIYAAGKPGYNIQQTHPQQWSEFSSADVDPLEDMTIWTMQEHTNKESNTQWAVSVVQLMAPELPASATEQILLSRELSSVSVTIIGQQAIPQKGGYYDPGAGFPRRLTASSRGVLINSITYNSPTSITLDISTMGSLPGVYDITIINPDRQAISYAQQIMVI